MSEIRGPVIEPMNGGAPRSAVILLHGLGANGDNLIDIGSMLAPEMPDTLFVAPNAPFDFDMMPGSGGYQWFSLTNWSPRSMLEGAQTAAPVLDNYIDAISEHFQLPMEKIALIGFSQGTMMALHVALRREKKLGCIVGFSGALIAPELLGTELKSKPDICLVHGQEDTVVPFPSMNIARTELRKLGLSVDAHARPGLEHSIDMQGINIAQEFLQKHLA